MVKPSNFLILNKYHMHKWTDKYSQYILMGPAVLFLGLLLFFPIIYTFWQSMLDARLSDTTAVPFIGLNNYWKVISNSAFWVSVEVTLLYTVLALVFETVIGVGLALLYNKNFFGRGTLRTLAIMPMAATPVSIGLIFTMIYNPTLGLGNYLLGKLGLPPSLWIYSSTTVIPSLVLLDIWQWTSMLLIIALAGLASLPADIYESAKVDGAKSWQRLAYITLPLLMPFIASAVIFRVTDALKTFDTIYVMTQGGPGISSTTLNILLYNQAFTYYNTGLASAQSIIFSIIIMLAVWYFVHNRRKETWI